MKKVLAIITAIMMMVMMMPFGAMAEQAEEETWNSYTLYNYISLDNGRTYISLETQENGIKTHKSAEEFHKENGNKRYDLNKDEYRIAGYDLTGLVIIHNGIRYVEKSAAKEGKPYFTAKLDRVEAVQCANFRDSSNIEPRTTRFESLGYSHITFHRNWYISFTTPKSGQKLLTGIQMPNGKYYGIDYTEEFEAIDSRTIPFNAKLSSGQYSIADYDFSKLDLQYEGETYSFRPEGPVAGDGKGFHYYTVSLMKIDKLAKSTYGGGYLKEGWPTWPLISGTNGAGTDGYAYKAGYYHRDYKVTLHVGDAPEAEIEETTIVEEVETVAEETVEEVKTEETEAVVEETIAEQEEVLSEIEEIKEETVETAEEELKENTEEEVIVEAEETEVEEATEEETVAETETTVEAEPEAEVEEAKAEEEAEVITEETAAEQEEIPAETEEINEEVEEAAEEEITENTVEETEVEVEEAEVQEVLEEAEMPAEEVQEPAEVQEAPVKKTGRKNNEVKEEQPSEMPEEDIKEQEVPLHEMNEETIEAQAVPLANYARPELMNEKTSSAAGWALADLILMIGTIGAAGFGIRNRKNMAIIMAAASAVVFILTQNMGGDMGIVDRWTVLMGAVFAAGTMIAAGRKAEER